MTWNHIARRVAGNGAKTCAAVLIAGATVASGQASLPPAPSAILRPIELAHGVMVEPAQPGSLALTLDDAVGLALRHNTEILIRTQQERFVAGQRLSAIQSLLPNLEVTAYTRAQEINLAAMGFKPGSVKIPGFTGSIAQIVKVNTTSAQVSLSQQLFNATTILLYRATGKAVDAAQWATLSARGGVVQQVGGLYLRILADGTMVENAAALVKQDELVYQHATASQEAGVGIHLDVLRAKVELQNGQQRLIQAENARAKDTFALNREMGQPAGQALTLVDKIPYAEYDTLAASSDANMKSALATAYERRKDLRGLEAQLEVAQVTRRALKYERVPTLGFGGFYGVLGETTGLYHGVFMAEGQVSIPVFQEAARRGQVEVAAAQEAGLKQQIAARREQIEADIRSSLLDVQSAGELVKVARSSADLARQALDDATLRFTAGIDDNLPVARAQATLEGAQARVVQAEFQFNYAKLSLARNSGVVETQYNQYLGR